MHIYIIYAYVQDTVCYRCVNKFLDCVSVVVLISFYLQKLKIKKKTNASSEIEKSKKHKDEHNKQCEKQKKADAWAEKEASLQETYV